MISVKCPVCGEFVAIDEKVETERKCPHCDNLIKLTKDNPEYAALLEQSEKLKGKCAKAVNEYSETGDAAKTIHPLLGSYADYITLPDFFKIWRDFILAAAAEAVSKKDTELQSLIKNHAKSFDEAMKGKDSLYLFLLMSNAKVGNNTDWDILIEQTCGDAVKFSSLVHSIKDYVVANRNKAFAIYVFNLLASKEEEWAKEAKSYLSTVLDDDEVAENVFPRRAFGGKTKKFIRKANGYCKKYCPEYVVEATKVWANYVAACKLQKRRNLGIAIGALAVVAGAAIGVTCYLNAIDRETVAFNIDAVITHTYGEAINLSDYTVTYKKNSGEKVKKIITDKMLSGYNAEVVGTLQTVFVEYAGVRKGITVIIDPAKLSTPVLSQSGNFVSWEFVPNAADYGVYVNSQTASTTTTTSLSYDLSDSGLFGELEIYVRANADGSGKYVQSDLSQKVTVTKLKAPQNIRYEDNTLKWDEVAGATKYELTVNGTTFYTDKNYYYETQFSQGDNTVKIVATASEAGVITGIAEQNIYHYKHQPVTNVTYTANRVYWKAEEAATAYDVYVDGMLWKEFDRKYFYVETDGFAKEFGNGVFAIDIVSKSSRTGAVPSEKAEFNVAIGNRISLTENTLSWDAVEADSSGAVTYSVLINESEPLTLSQPYFALTDANWKDGENTATVTAKYGSTTVVCETVKVTKLVKPQVSVSGGKWVTDGNADNRYSVNGGEWLTELPNLDDIAAGEYTVQAKRAKSSEDAFEIESDIVEIKLFKPAAPTSVSVSGGEIVCNYDKTKYDIKLYIADNENMPGGTYYELSSLSDIHMPGKHYIKAVLVGKEGANTEYDWVVPSDRSDHIEVTKLTTPALIYNQGDPAVTADIINSNLKFYYKQDGEEKELVGGLISNLPKGAFAVYARVEATKENELSSDNSRSVSVFNLDIALSVSRITSGTGRRFNVTFDGCEGIDELKFTYDIVHYNASGDKLGTIKVSETTTFTKEDNASDSIFGRLDFFADATFETRETRKIDLIVYISSGTETQQLTATVNI